MRSSLIALGEPFLLTGRKSVEACVVVVVVQPPAASANATQPDRNATRRAKE
jgi:hypothetical protein